MSTKTFSGSDYIIEGSNAVGGLGQIGVGDTATFQFSEDVDIQSYVVGISDFSLEYWDDSPNNVRGIECNLTVSNEITSNQIGPISATLKLYDDSGNVIDTTGKSWVTVGVVGAYGSNAGDVATLKGEILDGTNGTPTEDPSSASVNLDNFGGPGNNQVAFLSGFHMRYQNGDQEFNQMQASVSISARGNGSQMKGFATLTRDHPDVTKDIATAYGSAISQVSSANPKSLYFGTYTADAGDRGQEETNVALPNASGLKAGIPFLQSFDYRYTDPIKNRHLLQVETLLLAPTPAGLPSNERSYTEATIANFKSTDGKSINMRTYGLMHNKGSWSGGNYSYVIVGIT